MFFLLSYNDWEPMSNDWQLHMVSNTKEDIPKSLLEQLAGYKIIEGNVVEQQLPRDDWFHNYYKCPKCNNQWEDEWDCGCDDQCPNCGTRNISPVNSEPVGYKGRT